jgi:hypothetical protein
VFVVNTEDTGAKSGGDIEGDISTTYPWTRFVVALVES